MTITKAGVARIPEPSMPKQSSEPCQWTDAEILKGIKAKLPSCPHKHARQILKIIARRYWQETRLTAVVERVAGNYVRHDLTDYEELMNVHGLTQEEARIAVEDEVQDILRDWQFRG